MSVQAMSYVLDGHPAKGAERLVLLSLANHADGAGWECWPSVDLIAFEANLTTDHVRRCIRVLDERGWITRDVNAAPDDRIPADRRPNLYRIVKVADRRVRVEVLPVDGERVGLPRGDGYANGASTGRRGSPTKPSVEPSVEPSPANAPTQQPLSDDLAASHRRPPPASRFDEFWAVYPRHTAKGAARRAWTKALKSASPEVLIAGAVAYRNDPKRKREPEWTRYPATWLNDEGWLDEPTPAPSDEVVEH